MIRPGYGYDLDGRRIFERATFQVVEIVEVKIVIEKAHSKGAMNRHGRRSFDGLKTLHLPANGQCGNKPIRIQRFDRVAGNGKDIGDINGSVRGTYLRTFRGLEAFDRTYRL